MAMVDMDGSSLSADSQVKLVGLVSEGWQPSGAQSTLIKWTRWTLAVAWPWWQHQKHCHWY